MSIQPFQLILALLFMAMWTTFWMVPRLRIPVAILFVIIVFVNPLRFNQEGGASIERFSDQQEESPERITVDKQSFDERQQQEMQALKSQSKDLQHEIHD